MRLLAGDAAVAGGQRVTGPFGQSGLTSACALASAARSCSHARWPILARAEDSNPVDPHANSRPLAGHGTGAPPPVTAPLDPAQMFRETAFMIWGPDEDTREQTTVRPPTAPAGGQRGDPSARSGQTVPPALLQGNAGLDDAEARQAMNWVQWLQAQGAVVRDDGLWHRRAHLRCRRALAFSRPVPGTTQPAANTGFPDRHTRHWMERSSGDANGASDNASARADGRRSAVDVRGARATDQQTACRRRGCRREPEYQPGHKRPSAPHHTTATRWTRAYPGRAAVNRLRRQRTPGLRPIPAGCRKIIFPTILPRCVTETRNRSPGHSGRKPRSQRATPRQC